MPSPVSPSTSTRSRHAADLKSCQRPFAHLTCGYPPFTRRVVQPPTVGELELAHHSIGGILSYKPAFRRGATIVGTGVLGFSVAISGAGLATAAEPETLPGQRQVSAVAMSQVLVQDKTLELIHGEASMGITLPGRISEPEAPDLEGVPKTLVEAVGDPLLTTEIADASVSSFATPSGSQTLISIESAAAPDTYSFPLEAPAGTVTQLKDDGSVSFIDSDGEFVGGVKTPWAYDANGAKVPTSFELVNDNLIQTVEFDETTAFPVTADPNTVWGWTVCAATVGVNILPWGAAAKVASKLITRFGSIKRGVQIIWRAYHSKHGKAAKRNAAVAAAGSLFAELLGINDIKEKCFS